jgi:ryanodine receptor 2
MTYQPAPIDTHNISLPDDLVLLRERLSENAHDLWARQRMADGWVWGPRRDDGQKQHPCLIPYNELPESEKEYDRLMAVENLKTILALGFQITKSS